MRAAVTLALVVACTSGGELAADRYCSGIARSARSAPPQVLEDPAVADRDTFLDIVFMTSDDDASWAGPSAYAARVRALRDDASRICMFVVSDGPTPRLDELAAHVGSRLIRHELDDSGWELESALYVHLDLGPPADTPAVRLGFYTCGAGAR